MTFEWQSGLGSERSTLKEIISQKRMFLKTK